MLRKTFIILFATTALARLLNANENDAPTLSPVILPELTEEIDAFAEEVGSKVAKATLILDDDGDGRVEQTKLLRGLMGAGFTREAKTPVPQEIADAGMSETYHRAVAERDRIIAKTIVVGEDGKMGPTEWIASFRLAALDRATRRNVKQDVDQDGKLTLKEFATGIPIREGQVADDEGYTPQQRAAFARVDKNGDGYYAGTEWLGPRFFQEAENIANVLSIALNIRTLDTDSDGSLAKEEMGVVLETYPEAFPESIPLVEAIHYIRLIPDETQRELLAALLDPKS
ncbi:MAG: hypothetical protein AAGH40_07900 [Verrucomicrobiota bacterium]